MIASPILEFRNVSFSRGRHLLLDRMSFAIEQQDMIALVGPNGVGKTTLLKLACRQLPASNGEILLEGKPLPAWSRRALPRAVALVPQELDVPFNFPVQELVAEGRVPYQSLFGGDTPRDRAAVENAMEAVDITGLRHRVYAELSGGERQRVKLAIGLAQQPKLMLLDEPTQHLDIGRQIELLALLRRLNARGITILAAMHDLNLVAGNFSSAIMLTPEPSWTAGPVADILRPDRVADAFSIGRSALGRYFLAPEGEAMLQLR